MEPKVYIQEYIMKMKHIQEILLEFLDNENSVEEDFQKIIKYLDDQKIRENQHELKSILHLISKISNHHYRSTNFFTKIEQILKNYSEEIKSNFSNCELYTIFKNSKLLLLYLFEEKLLIPDQPLKSIITNDKYLDWFYPYYFYPEFRGLLNEKFNLIENLNEFESKRKIGLNDNYICKLIRDDSIDEFVTFVNQKNVSASSIVPDSIFETNPFLLKHQASLIEYSAFYGSIQIFRYLNLNGAKYSSSLWFYVIHGRNPEIIHILEEINFEKPKENYFECIVESIKCHHTEFTEYIQNNLFENKGDKDGPLFAKCLKFYNFIYLTDKFGDALKILDKFCNNEFINDEKEFDIFSEFCKYDFYSIVEFLIKTQNLNLKSKVVFKIQYFLNTNQFYCFYKIFKLLFFVKQSFVNFFFNIISYLINFE